MGKLINYIVFDFETGGLNCEKNPITQVALIVLKGDTLEELERYQTYVQNYCDLEYEKKALEYTGVTMDDINKGAPIQKVVAKMIEIFERYAEDKGRYKRNPIMVGHNIDNFDMDFLDYAFQACGKDVSDYISRTTKDTMLLAFDTWQHEDLQKWNLQICCERAGVDLVDAHDAMNDVEATANLFKFFINRLRGDNAGDLFAEPKKKFRADFKF